ncbi:hypothetical protein [Halomonas faecis]|uniref:hypothetical protein n=1 Tax=Halomonas faecis TaxID=1562110 RepID=UPI001F08AE28|nr:hypothetical protein [Halomonas faecis]
MIILPIVATLGHNLGADMTLVIGATLSASGCTPFQHAFTQLPYAALAGILAGLSRLVEGLSRDERRACCRLLADNVDAIGATLAREGIEAEFHKGGAIYAAARYPGQEAIQRAYLEHLHALGHAEEASN